MNWTSDNYTLNIDDNHYISFLSRNQRTGFAIDATAECETALIKREPWKCLIINGDWRKEYEELASKGYEACLEFYHSKPEHRSSWSED